MTVTSEICSVTYVANGAQELWPFEFLVYSQSEVQAWVTAPLGAPIQALGAVVSLTRAVGPGRGWRGGNVRLAVPAGYTLEIKRHIDFTQEAVDLGRASGFDPLAVMEAFDKCAMRDLQLRDQFTTASGIAGTVQTFLTAMDLVTNAYAFHREAATLRTIGPTGDYPSLQAALNDIKALCQQTEYELRYQTGYRPTGGTLVPPFDFSSVRITSTGNAPVVVHPTFVGIDLSSYPAMGPDLNERSGYFLVGYGNVKMPKLACIIDMTGRGGCGYALPWGGMGMILPGCGVINAGSHSVQVRNGLLIMHDAVGYGAQQAGVRAAYGAIITCQSADLHGCNVNPNSGPTQGTIDCSRTSMVHALGVDCSGGGGAVANVRRASSCTLQDSDGSGCATGIVATMGSTVNAISCNLSGMLGTGADALGRAVYASGSRVNIDGSDIRNQPLGVAAIRFMRGSHVSASVCIADGTGGVGGRIALTDCVPALINAISGHGTVFSEQWEPFTYWGDFSPSGLRNGKRIIEAGSVLQSSRNNDTTQAHLEFYNVNGFVGAINTAASQVNYVTSSDVRKKDVYGPVIGQINLPPTYRAKFKTEPESAIRTMCLAHEVQLTHPEAVNEDPDGFLGVDYSKLIPDIMAKVAQLEARIVELEG